MKRTKIKHTEVYIRITGKNTKFGYLMAKRLQTILNLLKEEYENN